jgi:hypothetical protein
MSIFVHIADSRDTKAICRSGLLLPKKQWRKFESERYKRGVFALPLVEDFMLSHQWVRELKRRGYHIAVGIYFQVADTELVWAGLYNQVKIQITAAEAAARLREERLLGYAVIIPKSISAAQITSTRILPSVGWRFFPKAKGNSPRCFCRVCNRGDINRRKMRARFDPNEECW